MNTNKSILDKNLYRTKELYFASILYALDVKMVEFTREGRVCWFDFADKEKCEDVYKKFISKDLMVNAKRYEEAIRTLKDLIFE